MIPDFFDHFYPNPTKSTLDLVSRRSFPATEPRGPRKGSRRGSEGVSEVVSEGFSKGYRRVLEGF